MKSIGHEIRDLAASVKQASPEQLAAVVATIDRMETRGAADALIAPLRGRLVSLGIVRPLSLSRLSFEPLSPLIVDGSAWRRGSPMVPRTALTPMFEVMRAGIPDYHAAEAWLKRAASDQTERAALASFLWDHGAKALLSSAVPTNWRDASGLSDADFLAIRGVVACLLSQADRLRALDPHAAEAYIAHQLREILVAASRSGPLAWQAMLVVLHGNRDFALLSQRLAQELAVTPELAQALDPAFFHTQDMLHGKMISLAESGRLTPSDLADMAAIAADIEIAAGPRSDRRQAAQQLRREVAEISTQAVSRQVDELLPVLGAADRAWTADAQDSAEATARSARGFGLISQDLGAGDRYESQIRPLIRRLMDPASPLDRVDRARLLEILGKNALAFELIKALKPKR